MTVSGTTGSVWLVQDTIPLRSLISWALGSCHHNVLVAAGRSATMFAGKGFAFGSAVMFAGIMTVIGGFGESLHHLSDGYGLKTGLFNL